MDCHWCRSGYERLSDDEIRNRFDHALANEAEQMFEDTLWKLEHAIYHKVWGGQPADAKDTAQECIIRFWKWWQRQKAAHGGKMPSLEAVDGEKIVGLINSMLKGFTVKGRRVPGKEKKILWENERRKATEISISQPIGGEESERTIGDTLPDSRPSCEDDKATATLPHRAIERAISDLDRLVGEVQVGATQETLAGMLSYAKQCVACSTVPVIVSAGVRYKNTDGSMVQMKRHRLGGVLVRQANGHPLDRLDHFKAQEPSVEFMQWQIRPEVSAYFKTLPGWDNLHQDTIYKRLDRAVNKLTEEKLLQLVPLTLEGDDYDILHLS